MTETLKDLFDVKTLALIALLGGGGTVGQYFGVTAPAKAEVGSIAVMTAEAQGLASDALAEVSKLQKLLAECQKRCSE